MSALGVLLLIALIVLMIGGEEYRIGISKGLCSFDALWAAAKTVWYVTLAVLALIMLYQVWKTYT